MFGVGGHGLPSGGNIEAAGDGRVVGKERVELHAAQALQRADLGRPSGSEDSDHAGGAEAVHGRHAHPARERRGEREEAAEASAGGAIKNGDVGAAARAGSHYYVRLAIAVDVAGSDVDAGGEVLVIGEVAL